VNGYTPPGLLSLDAEPVEHRESGFIREEAFAAMNQVEDPDSPVCIIISVDILTDGW
jgi:hypothetical protein